MLVAGGLFDVDVFARLAGPDRDEGVPVVRRGRGDRVDILAVEQFAHVGVAVHLDALVGEELDARIDMVLVRVTHRYVTDAGNLAEDLGMAAALRADADGSDP